MIAYGERPRVDRFLVSGIPHSIVSRSRLIVLLLFVATLTLSHVADRMSSRDALLCAMTESSVVSCGSKHLILARKVMGRHGLSALRSTGMASSCIGVVTLSIC